MKSIVRQLFFLLYGLLLCVPYNLNARAALARHEERFYKSINRTRLAIALFYQDYRAMRHCDSHQAEAMMRAERIFERVSQSCQFKEGGLLFIKASTLWPDMKDLAHSFGITQMPAVILFKESEVVRDANGKPALLKGIDSQEYLISFIKKYLAKELCENRQEYIHRQEIRALAGPQVSIGFGVGYWGPYGGYYDPYDYFPWYYYGGRSFGCGGCNGGCRRGNCCRPCRCR